MMTERHSDEPERVVVRDKRRIDPVTGEVREPAPASAGPDAGPTAGQPPAASALADATLVEERTRDLQRVQAEYANYRKRAERDRLQAGELGVGRALTELLPVLDDLDRAREHGDLTGALKAVGERIESALAKLGLERFGAVGDPFDPAIHEAVMHAENDDVAAPTCTTVMRAGYRLHDRLLRPAMVGVTDPASAAPPPSTAEPATAEPSAAAAPDADIDAESSDE